MNYILFGYFFTERFSEASINLMNCHNMVTGYIPVQGKISHSNHVAIIVTIACYVYNRLFSFSKSHLVFRVHTSWLSVQIIDRSITLSFSSVHFQQQCNVPEAYMAYHHFWFTILTEQKNCVHGHLRDYYCQYGSSSIDRRTKGEPAYYEIYICQLSTWRLEKT